jgi:ParB-like chromosome segregation protein Spo0J
MQNAPFTIRMLSIDSITISEDHRPIDVSVVRGLAESISQIGLRTPITVKMISENPILALAVTGVHRREACKMAGLTEIPCLVLESDAEARLWRRSENLHRSELTAQQRAEEIAAWIADVSALISAQAAQVSGGRGQRGGLSEIARVAGIDRTDAYRAAAIVGISQEAKSAVSALGLSDNQTALLEIARVDGPAAQVQKAQELAAKKQAPTTDQEFTALRRAWERSRTSVRSRFLTEVVTVTREPAKKTAAPQKKPIPGSDKKST